ncbi:saccharopine dehydrogenase family protein [Nocardioides albus]|uniref:Short subunit dehydrogenase-like uncharacterized protein n=1 Tax=Nocardioides albus TaxID=1841 RepID=A0A7W5A359_9ACTN|nr:saccharopine dehydrogenase NADP-binding domain-containing protein [Nocardioides albus]MBB3088656.1 short subunit dehydrogenase-like uncharacterized protein [Nocardioides albus]GGU17687.1 saccharopine dehydrogenase [Nocardioides albus]
MNMNERVLVYGATGHTGRFVVDELLRRGLEPVLAGRDAERLAAGPERFAGLERRVATVADPADLRRTLFGISAVVNCAGPFLDTALPLAGAAVEAGAHYLDVTAEQPVVQALYRDLDTPARAANVAVVPAMAFYGGLADLLVTTVLEGGSYADEVEVAIGLDRWWPTAGTRVTGARNTATRMVIRDGVLAPLESPAPSGAWTFDEPLGEQAVVQLPFSEVITIDRHLEVKALRSHLNTGSLDELRDADTPAPEAVDPQGRSAQRFFVDVVARNGDDLRGASVSGRDIYAVSAPIVVEGVARLLDGRHHGSGACAPGQAFDATDVLKALQQGGVIEMRTEVRRPAADCIPG